jgi:putative SOS response-associated peptidase YedK
MCYSARIISDWRRYQRAYGAELSLQDFYDVFWRRTREGKVKIPKAMELAFAEPTNEIERQIKDLIARFNEQEAVKLEQELFKQRKRLADAERSLQQNTSKAASESKRIAAGKVEWLLGKLADLRRTEPREEDDRIFPGHYAPVLLMQDGRRVVKPMRYQCRPAGTPAFYDTRFPGTYNARRDSLGGFWKELFGYSHGLMLMTAFYENVGRHRVEGRELAAGERAENMVLEFKPQPEQEMLVACLWSRWTAPGEPDLLSCAAITDDPPPEVAAAGHDRCIVPIRAENIDAWLGPDPRDLAAQQAILEDRARPYYEHRLAA